jgi:hypothetical protein
MTFNAAMGLAELGRMSVTAFDYASPRCSADERELAGAATRTLPHTGRLAERQRGPVRPTSIPWTKSVSDQALHEHSCDLCDLWWIIRATWAW